VDCLAEMRGDTHEENGTGGRTHGMTRQPSSTGIGKGRIEALADGVFAIAMTLLILDVKLPVLEADQARAELPRRLLELWPRLLAYAASFLILGVYWPGHHAHLLFIRRSDRL
jgi:uncharacterized membrane protein